MKSAKIVIPNNASIITPYTILFDSCSGTTLLLKRSCKIKFKLSNLIPLTSLAYHEKDLTLGTTIITIKGTLLANDPESRAAGIIISPKMLDFGTIRVGESVSRY